MPSVGEAMQPRTWNHVTIQQGLTNVFLVEGWLGSVDCGSKGTCKPQNWLERAERPHGPRKIGLSRPVLLQFCPSEGFFFPWRKFQI